MYTYNIVMSYVASIIYRIYSGELSWGAKFRVFQGQVFHMQSYWWMWFPGIEMRILEPQT